jgi:hypothetical protein
MTLSQKSLSSLRLRSAPVLLPPSLPVAPLLLIRKDAMPSNSGKEAFQVLERPTSGPKPVAESFHGDWTSCALIGAGSTEMNWRTESAAQTRNLGAMNGTCRKESKIRRVSLYGYLSSRHLVGALTLYTVGSTDHCVFHQDLRIPS